MLNQKSKRKLWQSVDPDEMLQNVVFHQGQHYLIKLRYNVQFSGTEVHNYLELSTMLVVFGCMGKNHRNTKG